LIHFGKFGISIQCGIKFDLIFEREDQRCRFLFDVAILLGLKYMLFCLISLLYGPKEELTLLRVVKGL